MELRLTQSLPSSRLRSASSIGQYLMTICHIGSCAITDLKLNPASSQWPVVQACPALQAQNTEGKGKKMEKGEARVP